jgi:hypothetical protein
VTLWISRAQSGVLAAALTLANLWCWAATAYAHPELERGKRLAYELDLEQAVSAFDAAVASGALTRTELLELLRERVLLLYALKRETALRSDLTWLSALDPEQKLDLRAPTELIALWTSIRDQGHGPLRLELATRMRDVPQEVRLEARAELTGTVPEGARTRISLRRKQELWRSQLGGAMHDQGAPGDSMQLYAEALGPGGTVVARLHSPTAPLQLTLRTSETERAGGEAAHADNGDRWGKRHRGWIIATTLVLVAAAAAVTTVFLLRDKGEDRSNETAVKPLLTF